MVVSSRFHGLISALSQGVPAIATGWSHKYQELFNDYQFLEGYLPLSISEEDLDMIFNRILLSKREETLNRIRASADIQKSLAEEMWEEIFNLI
jgi:colanic acid/amylovoran biosynthesis protein